MEKHVSYHTLAENIDEPRIITEKDVRAIMGITTDDDYLELVDDGIFPYPVYEFGNSLQDSRVIPVWFKLIQRLKMLSTDKALSARFDVPLDLVQAELVQATKAIT